MRLNLIIDGHSYKTADFTSGIATVEFEEIINNPYGGFTKEQIESSVNSDINRNKTIVDIRRLARSAGCKNSISSWNDKNGALNVVVRSEMENAPVVVRRKDSNVFITGYINMNHDSNGEERASVVKEAIEEYWSGMYNVEGQQINLITDIKGKGFNDNSPYFNVNIKKGNENSNSTWVFSGWGIDNNKVDLNLYWDENQSIEDTKGEIAHEFGHRLGLSDAYDTSISRYDRAVGKVAHFFTGDNFYLNRGRKDAPTETYLNGHHYIIPGDKTVKAVNKKGRVYDKLVHVGEKYDVMRAERDVKVSDYDVALVLEAFKYNKFQMFPEIC